ncbi:MAG: hypothetical protein NC253_07200 [Ruminococcus sp.]|nr:hypothetical protein [Ruminococcus sp.]MCM1381565.1 hypothetical protein [Muribaculaceae bacterium]MCM1479932.1 hypothetical protein [Muribaculaceae bacterium]
MNVLLKVPVIIILSVVGVIAMLALCGCAMWSFIYLIRYRLLKTEVNRERYKISRKNDIISVIIAAVTVVFVVLLLIYGVPFVIENIDLSKIPQPELPLNGGTAYERG